MSLESHWSFHRPKILPSLVSKNCLLARLLYVATFAFSFNFIAATNQLKECKISMPPGEVHPGVSLPGLVGHDAAQREGAT